MKLPRLTTRDYDLSSLHLRWRGKGDWRTYRFDPPVDIGKDDQCFVIPGFGLLVRRADGTEERHKRVLVEDATDA